MTLQSSGEVVTVSNQFLADGSEYALNAIEFDDGTVWDAATIKATVQQGTAGDDRLYSDAVGDTLDGLAGNDVVYGADGNDTLHGGDDNDRLYGRNGDDMLYGDAGDDVIYGQAGNDSLDGGEGKDRLYGGDGDDTLRGGTGSGDYLAGNAGNDTYLFGSGDGNTTINNKDSTIGRHDVLRFMSGIEVSDVVIDAQTKSPAGDAAKQWRSHHGQ